MFDRRHDMFGVRADVRQKIVPALLLVSEVAGSRACQRRAVPGREPMTSAPFTS
ncbi:hypothetical protein ACFXKX_33085 [Streptomyces scopuliridis]|uniref:hypothetical protein n=1 Tax=Streptomyces scopuliridis TaxID=452529 RepID=UPI003694EC8F